MTIADDPLQLLAKTFQSVQCMVRRMTVGDIENTERRLHGFAIGDRVAVTEGDHTGMYGKLTYVGGGWCNQAIQGMEHCRKTCWIFCLQPLGGPAGMSEDERWFPAALLTHVD